MPILLDHQLQEQMPQELRAFPVAFYCGELAGLPNRAGPVHWHPYLEIATAQSGEVDYQVGQTHTILQPGDSILVNRNVLHGIRQVSGTEPDPLPILVFSAAVLAPENSALHDKYIRPVLSCSALPFVVFRHDDGRWQAVRQQIRAACAAMQERPVCYELAVQRSLSSLWETVFRHFDDLPKTETTRVELNAQIRLQKMLSYLYENYARPITLADIAGAAHISRSEAGRCFQAYLGCSPVEALIRYRLQTARCLLRETTATVQQVSAACGFRSVHYFGRQFRKHYGCTPAQSRD